MLILPLHRSINRSNFPLFTILLVLANVFVYAFLQLPDGPIFQKAERYYEQSGLAEIETNAYVEWLATHGTEPRKIQQLRDGPLQIRFARMQSDTEFQSALHDGRAIKSGSVDYAQWHLQRAELDRILDSTFTQSHYLRYDTLSASRLLWQMFMHGDFEHIFGNMLFLIVLGMLIEGAVGPWWFLALYLTGGIVAGLTTLAVHWGGYSGSLGASGAIAALTGAYCVFWGKRKVRVFYWFFVVFDYVRAPALLLLPCWFAALVVVPWLEDGHTDFSDHFGGLLFGALAGLAMRHFGLVREPFINEDERVEKHERDNAELEKALKLIGELQIPKARTLLLHIDKEGPGQLRVIVALYRCARYRGSPTELDTAAARVFAFATDAKADAGELRTVFVDYVKACSGVPRQPPESLMALLPAFQRTGDDAAVESLLVAIAASKADFPALAAAWFALAVRTPEGSPHRRERLAHVVTTYAQTEFATKAQFLLSQA